MQKHFFDEEIIAVVPESEAGDCAGKLCRK